MKVVFAGGGTGGHLYPAIAIADALCARGATATFVGSADRLETRIVPQAGYALETIASRPLARGVPRGAAWLQAAGANAAGTLQSLRLLAGLRPDLVIATGGYVCFPVVLAAGMLRSVGIVRAPVALLEPNAHPGLTNRMLAPLVTEIWGAFEQTDPRFANNYVRTGVPIRASLQALPPRDRAVAGLGLDPSRPTLLAIGGSQGARSINDALLALRGDLPGSWQLIHVTGEQEYDRVRAAYGAAPAPVFAYLSDLSQAYAAADLVLARAGASTLAELAALGRPAILVPYPFAADDHQRANAAQFERAGAAVAIPDGELGAERLRAVLLELAAPERLAALRAGIRHLGTGDALATILARVDALTARRDVR